jgi:hypothetical protein
MWNEYAREKLMEIESERLRRRESVRASVQEPVRVRGPLAPAARATGRSLRRLGEAIENWATPRPDPLRSQGGEIGQSHTPASW